MSRFIEIPVVEGQTLRSGVRTVVGKISAGHLVGMSVVPGRDYHEQKGYQRPLSQKRVNDLAADLEIGTVDLPTAILVNLRDFEDDWLNGDNGHMTLTIPAETQIHVVDGQHRIGGLNHLIKKEESKEDESKWGSFSLQTVLMLGADESQEMRQFFVVNSTAKSVRTDLALDLLRQQAENDPDLMDRLIDKGEAWKVKAQALADRLGSDSAIWKGLIRFPGQPKAGTTISSSSMVLSLQGLMRHPYFGRLNNTSNEAKILDAYWSAIRRVLPDVFDEPVEHSLLKGLGAMVMHGIFPDVLEVLRSRGQSVVDATAYADVVEEALLSLQESTPEGGVVQGADFWKQAPEGAAATFSSSAGRRVLKARLAHRLPPPDVI